MLYYQVKAESDQTRINPNKTDILIGGELYTTKQVMKMKLTGVFISTHFKKVEISSRNTHYTFGARFKDSQ